MYFCIEQKFTSFISLNVLGMTLNCIHNFIVTGSFLYWCVMRSASQRFFKHSCVYPRILIISYLATFLGTNSLSVLMCRKAVNQSIISLNSAWRGSGINLLWSLLYILFCNNQVHIMTRMFRFISWSLCIIIWMIVIYTIHVQGKKLKREFLMLVRDLPSVYEDIAARLRPLNSAVQYYANFVSFTLSR